MISATTIKANAPLANRLARVCRPRKSRTQSRNADTSAAGMSTLMGRPRLAIINRPTSRKVPGVIADIDRLRLNQVPQKTPVTRENRSNVTN
jgi:hypothetical protein